MNCQGRCLLQYASSLCSIGSLSNAWYSWSWTASSLPQWCICQLHLWELWVLLQRDLWCASPLSPVWKSHNGFNDRIQEKQRKDIGWCHVAPSPANLDTEGQVTASHGGCNEISKQARKRLDSGRQGRKDRSLQSLLRLPLLWLAQCHRCTEQKTPHACCWVFPLLQHGQQQFWGALYCEKPATNSKYIYKGIIKRKNSTCRTESFFKRRQEAHLRGGEEEENVCSPVAGRFEGWTQSRSFCVSWSSAWRKSFRLLRSRGKLWKPPRLNSAWRLAYLRTSQRQAAHLRAQQISHCCYTTAWIERRFDFTRRKVLRTPTAISLVVGASTSISRLSACWNALCYNRAAAFCPLHESSLPPCICQPCMPIGDTETSLRSFNLILMFQTTALNQLEFTGYGRTVWTLQSLCSFDPWIIEIMLVFFGSLWQPGH